MAMQYGTVRRKAVIELRIMRALLRRSSRSRYAGHRIDKDGIELYQMRLDKRSKRENACCRIASGIPDDPRRPHLLTVELRQTIGTICIRIGMCHMIPLLIDSSIRKTIVRSEINDAYGACRNLLHNLHCVSMRKCNEEHVTVLSNAPYILH